MILSKKLYFIHNKTSFKTDVFLSTGCGNTIEDENFVLLLDIIHEIKDDTMKKKIKCFIDILKDDHDHFRILKLKQLQ